MWLLNDTPHQLINIRAVVTVRMGTQVVSSWQSAVASGPRASAQRLGRIEIRVPKVSGRTPISADAALLAADGRLLNHERFTLQGFPRPVIAADQFSGVRFWGESARRVLAQLDSASEGELELRSWNQEPCDVLVVDGDALARHGSRVEAQMRVGTTGVALVEPSPVDKELDYLPLRNITTGVYGLSFNREDPRFTGYHEEDFRFWYNHACDQIDFVAEHFLDRSGVRPLVFGYQPLWTGGRETDHKVKRAVVSEEVIGDGRCIQVGLSLSGRVGFNPVLDRFLLELLHQ